MPYRKSNKLISKSSIHKNKAYYEALGSHKGIPLPIDFYRFKRVREHLYGDSVLDAGCGKADFLSTIESDYQIAGIDVNKERVDYCNQVLGQDAVRLGNLDGRLDFENDSFDTVVCLEVLEHLEDPEKALRELVRVGRKRVIITVPFDEKIRYILCIHCAKYAPYPAHLHSFNKENIIGIIPDNSRIVKIELIGNDGVLSYFPGASFVFRLPIPISGTIDRILNGIIPRANWMMAVLDKTNDSK